ncbi:MAG: Ig-like domain-containing protein [Phycisphaeraceae bacterium]|nr:Ig-like domain-containing protein [Phycisphaeraceae bacterium]
MISVAQQLDSGTTLRAVQPSDVWVDLATLDRSEVTSGESSGEQTVGTLIFLTYESASYIAWKDVLVSALSGAAFAAYMPLRWSSSNEAVATVNENTGDVTPVAPGSCVISATPAKATGWKWSKAITVTQFVAQPTTVFDRYIEGTLAQVLSDAVDDRLAAAEAPAASKPMFTGVNSLRNADCWLTGVDRTCISFRHGSSSFIGGTLVAADVMLAAAHTGEMHKTSWGYLWAFSNSTDGAFALKQLFDRRVIAGTDIAVYKLGSAITGITPATVLPGDFRDYIPDIFARIPLVQINQEHKVLVADWTRFDTSVVCRPPLKASRQEFWEQLIVGDSGYGFFAVLEDRLVLVSQASSGLGGGIGPCISDYITEINTAISDMGSTSELTVEDLSIYEL